MHDDAIIWSGSTQPVYASESRRVWGIPVQRRVQCGHCEYVFFYPEKRIPRYANALKCPRCGTPNLY